MTTGKKVVLSLSILTILGVGGYLAYAYYKRKEKEKEEAAKTPKNEDVNTKPTTQTSQPIQQTNIDSPFPLSKGSKGANVVALQNLLNSLGSNLDTDGSFGRNTENEVKKYAGIPLIYKNQYPAFASGVVDIQGFNWLKNKLAQNNLQKNPINIFR